MGSLSRRLRRASPPAPKPPAPMTITRGPNSPPPIPPPTREELAARELAFLGVDPAAPGTDRTVFITDDPIKAPPAPAPGARLLPENARMRRGNAMRLLLAMAALGVDPIPGGRR